MIWEQMQLQEYNYLQAPLVWLACIPISMFICFVRDSLSLSSFRAGDRNT